jgi:hypothetical protein
MLSKLEPRLEAALSLPDTADTPSELLDVVVRFDIGALPTIDAEMPLAAQRQHRAAVVSNAVEQVVERVSELSGIQPTRVSPFPSTNSAFVQAPRKYIRVLVNQEEVAGAVLNATVGRVK